MTNKRADLSKMSEEERLEYKRKQRREAAKRYRERHRDNPEFREMKQYSNKKSTAKAFIREATDEDFRELLQIMNDQNTIRFGNPIMNEIIRESVEEPEKPVEEPKPLPKTAEEEIVEDFTESETELPKLQLVSEPEPTQESDQESDQNVLVLSPETEILLDRWDDMQKEMIIYKATVGGQIDETIIRYIAGAENAIEMVNRTKEY